MLHEDVDRESQDVDVFVETWARKTKDNRRSYALAVLGSVVFTSTCNKKASSFLTQVDEMFERWRVGGTIRPTDITRFYAWTHVLLINCSYRLAAPCSGVYIECIGQACLKLARGINKGGDKFLRTHVEIALEAIWCSLDRSPREGER